MASRPVLAAILFWIAAPLGATSLGFAIYFGFALMKIQPSRPVTLDPGAGPLETAAVGAAAAADLLGGMGKGFLGGLLVVALSVLAFSAALFFLSRKLR
jgi:hypothetical protein